MTEEAVLFGKTRSLVGIVTDPPRAQSNRSRPAVILLNSGILHRIGPNRLYVTIARKLAADGFVVFRFDFSGIGDSQVREDMLPFEKSVVAETQEAMDFLSASRGIERFAALGICSGAAVAFQSACADRRVVSAVLINTPGHRYGTTSELNRSMARHYRRLALTSSFGVKNWVKAFRGKVDYRGLLTVAAFQLKGLFVRRHVIPATASTITDGLRALTSRGVRLLLVHAEGDEGLDYLQLFLGDEIARLTSTGRLALEIIPGANHTFTLLSNQEDLLKVIDGWSHEET